MAKDQNKEAITLLEKVIVLLGGGKNSEVKMPKPDDVEGMEPEDVTSTCEAFGIETDGRKVKVQRALLLTAANIVDGETDDLDEDDVTALCEATGVAPKKKVAATVIALSEYFDSAGDNADGDGDGDGDGDDDDTDKKKKKKEKDDDDGDGDDDTDNKKKKNDDDDEPSEKEQAKRLAAYNEVAEKEASSYEKLMARIHKQDEDAEWGVPYVVKTGDGDDDYTAFCCGLELDPVKKGKKTFGKCQVTGKIFEQSEDGKLTEVEDD